MTAKRAGTAAAWAVAGVAVAAQVVLAVLAASDAEKFGWPLPTGYDSLNVVLVLAAAVTGLVGCAYVAARTMTSGRALRSMFGAARQPAPEAVLAAAAELGVADRIDAVHSDEPFAVTHGVARPRILVSTALACELTTAQITAVLAHEREHLLRRDPLRLLAARMLAAWAWYLPAARWLAGGVALRCELAADRVASGTAGRAVLAAALLRLASMPVSPAVAAACPAPRMPGSLHARVAQLESGRSPRRTLPRLAPASALGSVCGILVLAAAGTCCAAMSQLLAGGAL